MVTKTLNPAQLKALQAVLRKEDANKARRQRMHDRGEPILPPSDDEKPVPLECDLRSAPALVEAGMLKWARGFDALVTMTPEGRATARAKANPT